jgi:hypothetical protein
MLEQLHADKVTEQGARSSVVNGPFTGTKERRSFKPKVASSILVGRMEEKCRLTSAVGSGPSADLLCQLDDDLRAAGLEAGDRTSTLWLLSGQPG